MTFKLPYDELQEELIKGDKKFGEMKRKNKSEIFDKYYDANHEEINVSQILMNAEFYFKLMVQ